MSPDPALAGPRGLCAVVLAAGEGRRLWPLTDLLPKPLCPVANVALLDRTLDRLAALGLVGPGSVAVNACYRAEDIVGHVAGRAYPSVERHALGTGGGVANLARWIDGRDVLVCNADGYLSPDADAVGTLLAGRPADRPRVLVVPDAARGDFAEPPGPFGPGRDDSTVPPALPGPSRSAREPARSGPRRGAGSAPAGGGQCDPAARPRVLRFAGVSVAPWRLLAGLRPEPSELSTSVWRPAEAAGRLDLVRFGGVFVDCGTPADYLAANLHASGGASVVGAGAVVAGRLTRSVVWPGATVPAGEHLIDAIRARRADGSPLTVPAARIASPARGR